ncbi:MAG TPA: amidohydrolase family protein [Longimicrobium sp.]|nr:amidohydrolase family protein [Longimicrobium sp.]
MHLRTLSAAALLLLAGCAAHAPAPAPEPAAAGQPVDRIVPFGDYHTHLFTAAAVARVRPAPLPAVEMPAQLVPLLRERERLWNDPVGLAALYTEGSIAFTSRSGNWIQGRAAVGEHIGTLFARQYRITPSAVEVNDSAGFIAGYFTREIETGTRRFGYAHLSLRREADGAWRIAGETASFPGPESAEAMLPERLVALMDAGGIRKALVLSTAYWFGNEGEVVQEGEYEKVRAENDWFAEQVARFPDRLVGFCSLNPLKDYAVEEVARCAANPHLQGLKLHFGNSRVDLRNPRHVEKARAVFAAADRHRLPIVVHLMTPDTSYGREHSEIFLREIVTAAPDIAIQIAHMAGSGPYYNNDAAFAYFAEAAEAGDPRMRNVWTDVATVVTLDANQDLAIIARRLRQFGLERVLYASDTPAGAEYTPELGWLYFRRLPLTDAEFRAIADNVSPALR